MAEHTVFMALIEKGGSLNTGSIEVYGAKNKSN